MRAQIVFLSFLSIGAFAQNTATNPKATAPTEKPLLIFDPNRRQTEFDAQALEPADSTKRRGDRRNYDSRDDVSSNIRMSPWNRPAVGVWGALSNTGVTTAFLRRTNDKELVKNASEFGFGAGLHLDFTLPGLSNESLRLQTGFLRTKVHPNKSLTSKYTSSQLENTLSIFHLALLYRFSLDDLTKLKTLWWGFGGQMNYVFATGRPGGGSDPKSNLLNTYAFSPTLALGADLPIASWNDLTLQAEWHPMKGYSFRFGMRTTL